MAESIVTDWINDFNALEPEELKSFAALHSDNHELSTAIHSVLNDRSKHQEVKIYFIRGSQGNINSINLATSLNALIKCCSLFFLVSPFDLQSTLQLLSIK